MQRHLHELIAFDPDQAVAVGTDLLELLAQLFHEDDCSQEAVEREARRCATFRGVEGCGGERFVNKPMNDRAKKGLPYLHNN